MLERRRAKGERADRSIACEIAMTTSSEHELGNVFKCIEAGFEEIVVLSLDRRRLDQIAEGLDQKLDPDDRGRVRCLTPEAFLAELSEEPVAEGRVAGYKVTLRRRVGQGEKEQKRRTIAETLLKSFKRRKD